MVVACELAWPPSIEECERHEELKPTSHAARDIGLFPLSVPRMGVEEMLSVFERGRLEEPRTHAHTHEPKVGTISSSSSSKQSCLSILSLSLSLVTKPHFMGDPHWLHSERKKWRERESGDRCHLYCTEKKDDWNGERNSPWTNEAKLKSIINLVSVSLSLSFLSQFCCRCCCCCCCCCCRSPLA